MTLISEITSTQWSLDMNNPGKVVQGIDAIKQRVLIILTTQLGSNPMQWDFGCGAFEYIDKPVNYAVPRMVKAMAAALARWEPDIENVKISQATDVSQTTFTVSYHIKDTKLFDQLDITYGNTSNT